jgi:hypothetical protein
MKELDGIPEGYAHKATSDSFLGTESVVIYHNSTEDRYFISVQPHADEFEEMYVTEQQLELLVQSANDVLDMR